MASALGYCRVCDQLVNITTHVQSRVGKQVAWYPLEHEGKDGKRCSGYKVPLL